jgi:hypothetical protein
MMHLCVKDDNIMMNYVMDMAVTLVIWLESMNGHI